MPETINNDMAKKLSNAEISRYSRQLILPEIGVEGKLSCYMYLKVNRYTYRRSNSVKSILPPI